MGGKHAGAAASGITWTGGISAARYFAMTGLVVAMYAVATWALDVPARPVLLGLVLVGGLVVGAAMAHLRPRSRPTPGRASGRVGAATRSTIAGLSGAGLVLAQVLTDDSVGWVALGLCAMSVSAAGYSWRRDGRLTAPEDDAHPS